MNTPTPFDRTFTCPKCQYLGVDVEYREGADEHISYGKLRPSYPDALICACPRCKFCYQMATADSTVPTSVSEPQEEEGCQ